MRTKLPHEVKSEETKQKILTATERMLAEYDFKYLTVRNICEESGVAYGSFYHHFSSKENLLYIYTNQLYQRVREDNPIPEWVERHDYIKQSVWHIIVYGYFCEAVGKDLIKFLYQNCPTEMFEQTFQEMILPILKEADENGFIDPARQHPSNLPSLQLLEKDLGITYKGAVLWWSCYSKEDDEPLHETLEHLTFNMLFAYCSDKFRMSEHTRELLTESAQFPGSIVIRDIGLFHDAD